MPHATESQASTAVDTDTQMSDRPNNETPADNKPDLDDMFDDDDDDDDEFASSAPIKAEVVSQPGQPYVLAHMYLHVE